MALWEYKVITSGKGGFATPALLEKFLNDLGREEWEIIDFRSASDNPLAFTGLARRPTQRDWTLEDAAAAAAKAEAEKLRAEFSAKFQAATSNGPSAEDKSPSFLEEKIAPADDFRKPIDTSHDSDPEASDEEAAEKREWEQLETEDELPSFFDALKPHMRRNQRGPGMSVGTDYLAKKWGLDESDIKNALVECGLQIPADENAKPVYVEYDGDLYWVNINRRGEVWINTREKPRPVFRVVQATKLTPETPEEPAGAEDKAPRPEDKPAREPREPKPETVRHRERPSRQPEMPAPVAGAEAPAEAPATAAPVGAALPEGPALLERIRPLMRRNRRGPGGSGSASFLARALKCSEADLIARFATLGLTLPANPKDQPINLERGNEIWWLNQDSRGGVWINGRERRESDKAKPAAPEAQAGTSSPATADATLAPEVAGAGPTAPIEPAVPASAEAPELPLTPAPALENAELIPSGPKAEVPAAPAAAPSAAAAGEPTSVLSAIRVLLQPTRTGSVAGKVERVAAELGKAPEEITASLIAAGLKVPEKSREKPTFVEHAGEIFWFNKNAKDELWVNAKASKFSDKPESGGEDAGAPAPRSRRGGRSRKSADGASEPTAQ